jgi:hypothetical protein
MPPVYFGGLLHKGHLCGWTLSIHPATPPTKRARPDPCSAVNESDTSLPCGKLMWCHYAGHTSSAALSLPTCIRTPLGSYPRIVDHQEDVSMGTGPSSQDFIRRSTKIYAKPWLCWTLSEEGQPISALPENGLGMLGRLLPCLSRNMMP